MSHTHVSQRVCQFVKSIQHASKEEVLGLLLNIFEEGFVKVYRSYYIYLNKAARKNENSPFLIMMFKFVFG